ncbi:MAG: hypothetical protein ACTHKL_24535, partial [Streptosporangiaceae bacterium]
PANRLKVLWQRIPRTAVRVPVSCNMLLRGASLGIGIREGEMVGRLQLCAGLTAGLLAVAACGSEPGGGTRPTGRPVARAWLTGVTAMSGDDAWAVGAFRHARDDLPLIEHWDGRTWTVMRADRNSPASPPHHRLSPGRSARPITPTT